jgi:RHH-type proline utilization regulon transcriptional repressor/proline dehydrogenase/delta 1-pyrroline-5-carboxylate dehydrogenase
MLGEAATTSADAERYFAAYAEAIHAIGQAGGGRGVAHGPGISVKLSALHPRYCRAQRQRVRDELYPRLLALAVLARDYGIGLNIDAEEAERLELSLDLVERLAFEPTLAGWPGLGVVAQAYQKRCPPLLDYLAALARASGRRMMVRLVKGAYWDSEIKRAQVDGQAGYPVFTRKLHTDLCYLVCAGRLLAAADLIYPQFATHNAHTLATVTRMAAARGVTDYEFQCLHGMGEALYDNVVRVDETSGRCRIYAPVGSHQTLLPYLVRRLLENGANSSFVNRIVDEKVSIDELIVDPLSQVLAEGGLPHPKIPLPAALYGEARVNSAGLDLANEIVLGELDANLAHLRERHWQAEPILAGVGAIGGERSAIVNPADRGDRVGTVTAASTADIAQALAAASAYADHWRRVPASERATLLRRAADELEAHRDELISLCVREAGKTWSNAVAEIREAVDFCRYYAAQSERLDGTPGASPGVVAAISPWNFPLAIFVGEISAALAAGSPVLAKPAEQTPLIAAHAVRLLHAAGIPPAALQLLPGRGETVGAALTGDPRIGGVIFTGSTEVAQLINRSLAARPAELPEARLIAETGGQNAMVVDSSALPEQVVQDVLVSAFDSAGQRCSALRVLCLQDDIADHVVALLKAAMRELAIGDPGELATDVGPVIDEAARAGLLAHIQAMRDAGHAVFQCALPPACAAGCFVPPTLIEIDRLGELEREVFGPVLHVLRFAGEALDATVDAINATGYGLTFGMHSRIDERIERVVSRLRVGNVYINRNMVGAVVGVQPFGGEGQSGTGPKAGGPLYLPRLAGVANPTPAALGLTRRSELGGADRDSSDRLAAFEALATWAHRQGLAALGHACAEYAAASLLACGAELPGPTGERNTLVFAPRGLVACHANREDALLVQIAAALATGNTPTIAGGAPAAVIDRLPAAVRDCLQTLDGQRPAAILYAGPADALAQLRQQAAAAEGALLPVVTADPASGHYPLYRLLCERVRSVNTTAAGGNTSLMMLAQ